MVGFLIEALLPTEFHQLNTELKHDHRIDRVQLFCVSFSTVYKHLHKGWFWRMVSLRTRITTCRELKVHRYHADWTSGQGSFYLHTVYQKRARLVRNSRCLHKSYLWRRMGAASGSRRRRPDFWWSITPNACLGSTRLSQPIRCREVELICIFDIFGVRFFWDVLENTYRYLSLLPMRLTPLAY